MLRKMLVVRKKTQKLCWQLNIPFLIECFLVFWVVIVLKKAYIIIVYTFSLEYKEKKLLKVKKEYLEVWKVSQTLIHCEKPFNYMKTE